jgi:hypothetical protein
MRFAAELEDDRPDNDAAFAREAFEVLAIERNASSNFTMYLCLVIRGGGRRYLLIVLVGNSDALKGGFEIGDLHCVECLIDEREEVTENTKSVARRCCRSQSMSCVGPGGRYYQQFGPCLGLCKQAWLL